MTTGMSHPRKSIIFSVECHHMATITVAIFNLQGSFKSIGFTGNRIAVRFEAVEKLANVVMCIKLCICKLRI